MEISEVIADYEARQERINRANLGDCEYCGQEATHRLYAKVPITEGTVKPLRPHSERTHFSCKKDIKEVRGTLEQIMAVNYNIVSFDIAVEPLE